MKTSKRCPHCGNTNPKLLQDNGEEPSSLDLTLLCVARVAPSAWSFDHVKPLPEDHDASGLVPCGMQWDPNTSAEAV
jgi:hypothetical protein